MTRVVVLALFLTLSTSWLTAGSFAADEPADKLTVTKDLVYTVPDDVEVVGTLETVGMRWAWGCVRGGKHLCVVDCVEQKPYDHLYGFTFSAGGTRFAYAAGSGNKWFVVSDGVEQDAYDGICRAPLLSSDGTRLAYAAQAASEKVVVVDGAEEGHYDDIGGLAFSPDGKRLAYIAKSRGEWFVVLDGLKQEEHDRVHSPVFSPDGKRFAYVASARDQFIVLDGVDQKRYESGAGGGTPPPSLRYIAGELYANVGWPAFSPNSRRLAYAVATTGGQFIVLDGVEQARYDSVGPPTFSPDSERLAYWAHLEDGKDVVVVDGARQKGYESVEARSLCFSADSKHLAYKAHATGLQVIVADGVEHKRYTTVGYPAFTADGKHLAYWALPGGRDTEDWVLVLDGIEHRDCGIPGPLSCAQPDGIALLWYGIQEPAHGEAKGITHGSGTKLYRFMAR